MLGGEELRVPTSSLDGCSQALLLPRSRTSGARGGRSTPTWWTRTPPPSTLPGARRARRTPSSLSRKQRACGTSLRDPQPRSEKPLKGAGRRALLRQLLQGQKGHSSVPGLMWWQALPLCPCATPALSTRCPAPHAAETRQAPCPGAMEDDSLSVLARPAATPPSHQQPPREPRQCPTGLCGSVATPPAPAHPLFEELTDFYTHLVHSISLLPVLSLLSVWALFWCGTAVTPSPHLFLQGLAFLPGCGGGQFD